MRSKSLVKVVLVLEVAAFVACRPRREPTDSEVRSDGHESLLSQLPHDPAAHRDYVDRHDPAPRHWTYEADTGPDFWGELDPAFGPCATGERQSPIDIAGAGQTTYARPIEFVYGPQTATRNANLHAVQVDLAPGNHILFANKRFDLRQFHAHSPSEHLFAGKSEPLEIHLVHAAADARLAVVGVHFVIGPNDNPKVDELLKLLGPGPAAVAPGATFNPKGFLPATLAFYTYDGSLTTPPCSEGVRWLVMRDAQQISQRQYDAFRKLMPADPNARPAQELNRGRVAVNQQRRLFLLDPAASETRP